MRLLLLLAAVVGAAAVESAPPETATSTPAAAYDKGEQRLAHVSHPKAKSLRRRQLAGESSRAAQTVAANEWWCAHQDKVDGLSCRRHRLQQRHRQATDSAEREDVQRQLSSLLAGADEAALAALQEETRGMLRGFCALVTSRGLEVCAGARRRRDVKSKTQQARRRGGAGARSGAAAPAVGVRTGGDRSPAVKPRHGKRGIALLWTAESLSLLRAWWCADVRHTREPRCARGVRWTRQQPGLSAMRRLYCAQSEATNSSVPRLCLGVEGVAGAAVYEGSSSYEGSIMSSKAAARIGSYIYGATVPSQLRSGGGIAGSGGARRPPPRLIRQSTVIKLMIGMLLCAALMGWKARHHLVGRRAQTFVFHASGPPPASSEPTSDECYAVSGAGAAARRRPHLHPSKRARGV